MDRSSIETETMNTPINTGQMDGGVNVMLDSSSKKTCDSMVSSSSSKKTPESKRRTLMELASTPIKSVQMIVQLLSVCSHTEKLYTAGGSSIVFLA